jgi:hypothetical protein
MAVGFVFSTTCKRARNQSTAVLIRMAHGLRSGRLGRDPAILQKLGQDPAYVDPIKTSRVLSERKPL